ncbi:MAG: HAD family phosphatase [Acidobacteria bacterium]|nr:HAD family phosphatase [Acidobacteriota bacterium]MCU0254715.1 HAD family phosphatase [Acidobacteriota bacterium]
MTATGIRTICFDVDGTLVEHPEGKTIWQLVNERYAGGDELNRERMRAFRGGDITYAEWVELDVGDWASHGVGRAEIEGIVLGELQPVPGAFETVAQLAGRGYTLGLVSGTLNVTVDLLLSRLPFTYRFTNRIWFDEQGRIRRWRATRYDGEGKARALERIAAAEGISCAECAFVGDHWNDIPALTRAGFGVAYRPKEEEVRRAARAVIESGPLSAMLEWFPGPAR